MQLSQVSEEFFYTVSFDEYKWHAVVSVLFK